MNDSNKLLEIVYQDEYLVAINKPHGLLVHRSPIAADASEFALQLLRDQLEQRVYPAHRIDRKTGGCLLFSLDKELLPVLKSQFAERTTDKIYLAIVRGYLPDEGTIDYPLFNDAGKEQDAVTEFTCLGRSELPYPSGKFETSRYSLACIKPLTGRMHQIRKHMAHIFHPIIGDRPHGCNKQNKIFLERFNMNTMLLHAYSLSLKHPVTGEDLCMQSSPQGEFMRMLTELQLASAYSSFVD